MPPQQMTDTTQSKEIIQKYRHVFLNSIHFEMDNRDEMKFMANQFNEIEGEIELALEFIEQHNFGDDADYVKAYAVAVLPFMIFDGKLIEPNKETKESYEQALQFLRYIKYNKGMANHHIATTTTDKYTEGNPPIAFDDFKGFDMRKLDKEIDTYTFLSNMKVSPRRSWWSGIVQVRCFAYAVHTAWTPEECRIKGFLADFFDEFESAVDDEVIKQKIIQKAKDDDFIRLNPTFLLDNIL